MIYAFPGTSFEATTDWGTTGLVGTIGVSINDNVGGTVTPRTTMGITEIAPGIYAVTLTAPEQAGQYSLVWDDTAVYVPDDLTVTSSTAVQVQAAPTPASGMTLGQIIDDVILDSFDTVPRARVGRAINNRLAHLWSLEDWTFKYDTVNPTVTNGTRTLGGLPTDFGVAVTLWDENGDWPLEFLAIPEFYLRYLPATSGSPEAYTVTNQSILLGPTPDHSATYTLHYRKRMTLLSDENADVPAIPVEFHLALVHGGRAELLAAYNDPTAAQQEQQWQLDLDAMRRDYLTDVEGGPLRWGGNIEALYADRY